jgi:hypothetical protein
MADEPKFPHQRKLPNETRIAILERQLITLEKMDGPINIYEAQNRIGEEIHSLILAGELPEPTVIGDSLNVSVSSVTRYIRKRIARLKAGTPSPKPVEATPSNGTCSC